jgi:hypothetical protein
MLGTGLSFRHCRRRETFQRLNAVAGAVAHFQRGNDDGHRPGGAGRLGMPRSRTSSKASTSPPFRGMRINGQRVATWSSQHGWSGDTRPDAEWLQ